MGSMNVPHVDLPSVLPRKGRGLCRIALGCLGTVFSMAVVGHADGGSANGVFDTVSIRQALEGIRVKNGLPALAVALVEDGGQVVREAVGYRRHGGAEKALVNDKFHIGSVTKSMTATLAAILVEEGTISWTTTIGEAFPELGERTHPDYTGVTLEQLLAHRGGAPAEAPPNLWEEAWQGKGTPQEQRARFVQGILEQKPEVAPGTRQVYSNQGYAIAGAMLEKASGTAWEELMLTRLFEPLGMMSAGFGAPATVGKVDQPWGHRGEALDITPVSPGPGADNPAAIGPAGTVHCSLDDLAKYAVFHLDGGRGEGKLLRAQSFEKLHASRGNGEYALGWVVLEREWGAGRVLMHNGTNRMFYAVVWLAPERNIALIAAANIGGESAAIGCDEAVSMLLKHLF